MWKCLVYIAVLVDLTIRGMFYLSVSIYPVMIFVSEYWKRDLMAQTLFFLELLIPSYSMIFEL